ncbi:MAG: electron transport complex subunit RsxG [Methylococcaceae bacterium]|nr:electron transport complex subunit RsxG [Methylococcaceae bacterium]
MSFTPPTLAALRIGLFSFIIVGLVSVVYHGTKDKIADNERRALLHSLQSVIDKRLYDNDLANDKIQLNANGQTHTIYRARQAGKPIAAIITSTTTQGYNGDIDLLIAINVSGTINAVRVLNHRETPSLGDAIELKKSDWILSFSKLALQNLDQWAVKRDGGNFDQFTGATITPRAIVNEVKNTALFFQQHQHEIFQ